MFAISAKPIQFCSSRTAASHGLTPNGRGERAGQVNVIFARGTWKNLRPQKPIMESALQTALQRGGLQACLTSRGMRARAEVQAQQQASPQTG